MVLCLQSINRYCVVKSAWVMYIRHYRMNVIHPKVIQYNVILRVCMQSVGMVCVPVKWERPVRRALSTVVLNNRAPSTHRGSLLASLYLLFYCLYLPLP